MMTICHRPVGGPPQTLTLPRPAAEAHLLQHPRDTPGVCPTVDVAPEEPAESESDSSSVKKKPAKKKSAKKS